jgi:thioredoxin 1
MEVKKSFQELIASDEPVFVDFYATWCGPCKAMNPVIQELAKEVSGAARIIKIDIDKNQQAAMKYGVQAVPTFVIFKKGEVVWRHTGGTSLSNLKQAVTQFA